MYRSDVETINKLAEKKVRYADEQPGKYIGRSVLTGFYIMVAMILSYTTGGIMYPVSHEVAKIIVASTFCFAIAMIVFLSGELFTGNNFVMCVGMYEKRVTLAKSLKIWAYSFLGNAIGLIIFGYLFIKSGASLSAIQNYVEPLVASKLELSIPQMILRGALCNFSVCLAYLSGIKMKTEFGKLAMMFFAVFTFIIAGFEHSIANVGVFAVGYFALGGLPMMLVLKNLFFVVIGNIIGGGILLALPIVYISTEE